MTEAQGAGMEHLAGTEAKAIGDEGPVRGRALATQYLAAAIALVGKEWVAYVLHVSTYLMGAPRFEPTLHQRGVAVALQHTIVGDGRLAYIG